MNVLPSTLLCLLWDLLRKMYTLLAIIILIATIIIPQVKLFENPLDFVIFSDNLLNLVGSFAHASYVNKSLYLHVARLAPKEV